jgi:hypothetical protein
MEQDMKPLTTEPSLVEPQPVEKEYNVVWEDSSHFPLNDEPFETKGEAWAFILDDLGLKIVEVKPLSTKDRSDMKDT